MGNGKDGDITAAPATVEAPHAVLEVLVVAPSVEVAPEVGGNFLKPQWCFSFNDQKHPTSMKSVF